MNKWKLLAASAGLMTVLSITPASALTTTIDFGSFTGGAAEQTSHTGYSYSLLSGVTLDVTAAVTDNSHNQVGTTSTTAVTRTKNIPGNNTPGNKAANLGGLGELNDKGDTSHDIDGAVLRNDLLKFNFSHAVKLVSIRFSRVDGNDVFDFWKGGAYQFTSPTPLFPLIYTFAPNTIGKMFGFGTTSDVSDYKIRSITVSAVPLPPSALLFLTGLLGVGLLGRRRSKSVL